MRRKILQEVMALRLKLGDEAKEKFGARGRLDRERERGGGKQGKRWREKRRERDRFGNGFNLAGWWSRNGS